MIMRQHHTQFPGNGRTEVEAVGTPMWPGYALRSIGLFFAVAAVLFLLGGLVQINPIWLWGPYEPHLSTNAAQPDWYLGWLIGGLRIVPPIDVNLWGYTLIPNPFWGGLFFPTAVFAILYLWPWIDRRRWSDGERHNLLDRPRDNPRRTGSFFALAAFVMTVFLPGSSDRLFFRAQISYEAQIWFWRGAAIVLPVLTYLFVRRLCEELRDRGGTPLQGWTGRVVRRTPSGGWETVDSAGEREPLER
jgi:ubiquinol-cytochrome c reductase cytochrome b subunit